MTDYIILLIVYLICRFVNPAKIVLYFNLVWNFRSILFGLTGDMTTSPTWIPALLRSGGGGSPFYPLPRHPSYYQGISILVDVDHQEVAHLWPPRHHQPPHQSHWNEHQRCQDLKGGIATAALCSGCLSLVIKCTAFLFIYFALSFAYCCSALPFEYLYDICIKLLHHLTPAPPLLVFCFPVPMISFLRKRSI